MGYVTSWVKTAIPSGIVATTTIDPIARHNIFVHNIQPKLSTEFMQLKFNRNNLLTKPLIVLPFMIATFDQKTDSSKDIFLFTAKVKSVEQLAVSDDDKLSTSEMDAVGTSYAYIVNSIELLLTEKTGRFQLLAQNFKAASEALVNRKGQEVTQQRMNGLYFASLGMEAMLDGEIEAAKENIEKAVEEISQAKEKVTTDFDLSVTLPAVEQELAVARCVATIIEIAARNPMGPLETVGKLEHLIRAMNSYQIQSNRWMTHFSNLKRYEEIMNQISIIARAKNGENVIKVCGGGGNVLVPFWVVHIDYMFSTGALFMKKGRVITEPLLLAATFPADTQCLSDAPERVVTDIFTTRAGIPTIASLAGRETTLTTAYAVQQILTSVTITNASGRQVVIPLSTKNEADNFIDYYRSKKEMSLAGKAKIIADRIVDLVFLPGIYTNGHIDFSYILGALAPATVGEPSTIEKVIL